MKVVITGGPGCGKTTTINILAEYGYMTYPESALTVIQQLNEQYGIEGQKQWRQTHQTDFQDRICLQQSSIENIHTEGIVFYDRGGLDGIAYSMFYKTQVPERIYSEYTRGNFHYDLVCILGLIEPFPYRPETGRILTEDNAKTLQHMITVVYKDFNIPVIYIPYNSDTLYRVNQILTAALQQKGL